MNLYSGTWGDVKHLCPLHHFHQTLSQQHGLWERIWKEENSRGWTLPQSWSRNWGVGGTSNNGRRHLYPWPALGEMPSSALPPLFSLLENSLLTYLFLPFHTSQALSSLKAGVVSFLSLNPRITSAMPSAQWKKLNRWINRWISHLANNAYCLKDSGQSFCVTLYKSLSSSGPQFFLL